jgi:hypothetical protein
MFHEYLSLFFYYIGPSLISSNIHHLQQQQQLNEALSRRPGDLSVSSIGRASSIDPSRGQNKALIAVLKFPLSDVV